MADHVPPSVEVAREQAIANVYQQIGSMQFTTADDAYDAALAIAKLSEATHEATEDIQYVAILEAHPEDMAD